MSIVTLSDNEFPKFLKVLTTCDVLKLRLNFLGIMFVTL